MILTAALVPGCVPQPEPLPEIPAPVRKIAVLPPNNQTGQSLEITATSLLDKYTFRSIHPTVPDVLAAEARSQLSQRGYNVTEPQIVDAACAGKTPTSVQNAAEIATRGGLEGASLYIDLRRWEPDASFQPAAVMVWIELSLIDPPTGKVLWSAQPDPEEVKTPGAVNLGDAYVAAARTIIRRLLSPP